MRILPHAFRFALLFAIALCSQSPAAEISLTTRLASDLTPLAGLISGKHEEFALQGTVSLPIDKQQQEIDVQLRLQKNGNYELLLMQKDYSVVIQRTAESTTFALPHHAVAFVGKGESDPSDHLTANGVISRLISDRSNVNQYSSLITNAEPQTLALLMTTLMKPVWDSDSETWTFDKSTQVKFEREGQGAVVQNKETTVKWSLDTTSVDSLTWKLPADYQVVSIPRPELERQLVRGVRRATEILSPSSTLTNPRRENRRAPHGELRWIDGHRVVLLAGTPQQIGHSHGELLKEEALKTIDSVLYTFGTFNTIRSGKWFRHELNSAYSRLSPHIPQDHKDETSALAVTLGIDDELAQAINVFPELFHCSGFAVFGSATKGGKLYHGRVLDYMTTIGLQDAATTFIVSVDGKIPFANVGYAGFIGSVTGMNNKAIGLGEMGGRGEGAWDGVPMATLMRRALEECSTLEEVMTLWKDNPRTCEYYYVFSDGKTNEAVGVAATPESIEFILPGQGHERLGEGIADTVVLSAGSRLEKLRERVIEKHGEIDAETAIWLMCRPVAMQSNLHNALFVPQDGILYVANADHKHPAADRPYVKLDLKQLINSFPLRETLSTTAEE